MQQSDFSDDYDLTHLLPWCADTEVTKCWKWGDRPPAIALNILKMI
ncbi:MAG: hypothetical protein IGR76_08290 [Synechococcales cyanobacterium T60_A2020_003]|nr:hypothetical protein [Synechococcales cyanobacterium T60_A2020_003]